MCNLLFKIVTMMILTPMTKALLFIMKIMMEPMVSEMELSIDCDYIGQPDHTKITIHWYCHIQLDPYIEQLESFKNVMKIEVYNTHHHILKTRSHANLDKVCKNGKTTKSYLEKFNSLTAKSVLAGQKIIPP